MMREEPVLISQESDDIEILVVQVKIGKMAVRLITGYGPQEDAAAEIITSFYSKLEEEIISCKII